MLPTLDPDRQRSGYSFKLACPCIRHHFKHKPLRFAGHHAFVHQHETALAPMQGAGDSNGCFVLNLASMWGIRLTLAVLLAPRFGLVGVWFAMCAELCTRGVLFLLRLARGKWLDKGALA